MFRSSAVLAVTISVIRRSLVTYNGVRQCVRFCEDVRVGLTTATPFSLGLQLQRLIPAGKLQRVLNTAARVVSDSRKFDCDPTQPLQAQLRYEVHQRVRYKLGVMTRRRQNSSATDFQLINSNDRPNVYGKKKKSAAHRSPNCFSAIIIP